MLVAIAKSPIPSQAKSVNGEKMTQDYLINPSQRVYTNVSKGQLGSNQGQEKI